MTTIDTGADAVERLAQDAELAGEGECPLSPRQLRDTAATLRALLVERNRMREALIRLRDCDWVRGPGDRMDAVRDIARAALAQESADK